MSLANHPDVGYEKTFFIAATPGAGTQVKNGGTFLSSISWEAGANLISVYDGAVAAPNLKAVIDAAAISNTQIFNAKFVNELRIVTTGAFGVTVVWL